MHVGRDAAMIAHPPTRARPVLHRTMSSSAGAGQPSGSGGQPSRVAVVDNQAASWG